MVFLELFIMNRLCCNVREVDKDGEFERTRFLSFVKERTCSSYILQIKTKITFKSLFSSFKD